MSKCIKKENIKTKVNNKNKEAARAKKRKIKENEED